MPTHAPSPETARRRTLHLHPDDLYDRPYETVELDLRPYAAITPSQPARTADHGLTIPTANGALQVSAVEGLMRLRWCKHPKASPRSTTEELGLIRFPASPEALALTQDDRRTQATSSAFQLTIDRTTGDITVADRHGRTLWQTCDGGIRLDSTGDPQGRPPFYIESVLPSDECVFGFGGRIMPIDRTGTSADIFSVKTGVRSGDYGGFPIPLFYSNRGYGFFLNNPWPHVYFDMGRSDPARWFVHAPGGDLDIVLIAGPDLPTMVRRWTAMVGRIPVVPRWMLGYWCSSLSFKTAEQAIADARRMRDEGYPTDVFVFDGPWRGGLAFGATYQQNQEYPSNDMEWHPDFGDGPPMIDALRAMGIHTCLHLNSRNYRPETAERGVAEGLLRQQGREVVVRVLDERGEQAYRDRLQPRIDEGVESWWTDHADRVSGELRPGLPSRNLFGPLWNRLICNQMADAGRPGALCLSRGGGIGSQPYAVPWPGDTRCGMDGLPEDIAFMVSAGLAGFPLTSADLAGFVPSGDVHTDYATPQAMLDEMFDDENICRRLCQGLIFTPVPRMHNNESTIPKWPWNCSPRVRPLYRQALEERYRLTPYLYSHVLAASVTGDPLLRPMIYHHPDDAEAAAQLTQFYLGDSLLVAPVTEKGRTTQRVYLPAGRWVHRWSGREFEGGWVEVEAPLYDVSGLPMFVRRGSIIATQPLSQSLGDRPPQCLIFEVYPRGTTTVDLRETADACSTVSCQCTKETLTLRFANAVAEDRQVIFRFTGPWGEGDKRIEAVTDPLGRSWRQVALNAATGGDVRVTLKRS
ncbi:MAG TPA: hypothetical protein DCX07_13555 [Phycisphaerales bacterium]|nr:hypothetical protein [Phycisphaerales bacterium]